MSPTTESTWDRDTLRFQARCVTEMVRILRKFLDPEALGLAYGVTDEDVRIIAETVLTTALQADIERLVESDPATRVAGKNAREYVLETYKGVRAILHYRIANALLTQNHLARSNNQYRDVLDQEWPSSSSTDDSDAYFISAARKISEEAAVLTTIEINPSAKIGKGLIIDHGVNVKIGTEPEGGIVVGEQCIIGENCTLLNGVVLGASEVNTGRPYASRRHPKLGNQVTVCAGARILGGITIGDSAWIGPGCIITHDVLNGAKVSMLTELQYERPGSHADMSTPIRFYGLVPNGSSLTLYGEGLDGATLRLIDRAGLPVGGASIAVTSSNQECVEFRLVLERDFPLDLRPTLEIVANQQRLNLICPPALSRAIERRDQNGANDEL